jgi:hypothetical protein
MALAEFRRIGERSGLSFALTELANRIAMRGEFAGACEYYEQAIAVITELGAIEDVIRMRSRQAQLYWLSGDADSSAAAMAEAQRSAKRVTWPMRWSSWPWRRRSSLAGGRRRGGTPQLGVATAMLGDDASGRRSARGTRPARLPRRDLDEARAHRVAACQAASEVGHALLTARILVGSRTWRCAANSTRRLRGCSQRARRARPVGSFPTGCGQDRADGAASPRRGTVRRGDAGGYADELASAGRGHARVLRVSCHAWMTMSPCRVRACTETVAPDVAGLPCADNGVAHRPPLAVDVDVRAVPSLMPTSMSPEPFISLA